MRTLLQTLQCSLLSSDILSWHWTEWVSLTGSGHMVRTGQTGGEKELEPPHMNAGTVEWEKQAFGMWSRYRWALVGGLSAVADMSPGPI